MTNLNSLLNSIQKAKEEKFQFIKNGQPGNTGFIAIHQDKAYNITIENNEIISCTCPHHHFRGQICKHMIQLSMEKGLNIQRLNVEQGA